MSKCQKVSGHGGRGPLCVKFSKKKVVACVNVSRPTLRVKTLTHGRAPLCQISKKKVVACVKFWGDPRPVSNYGRPPGPVSKCQISPGPVSKCQISAGPGAPTIPLHYPAPLLFEAARCRPTDLTPPQVGQQMALCDQPRGIAKDARTMARK